MIAFDVDAEQVSIIGVFYGGQDYETFLTDDQGHAEQVLARAGALVWDGLQGAKHSHSPAMARICKAADRPKQG